MDGNPSSPTYGQILSIVITNPGTGYTSAPTVALMGGGGTYTGTITPTMNTSSSGGLTVMDSGSGGVLTLSNTNTYTGTTTVNGGMLVAVGPQSLPNYGVSGKVAVNSGGGLGVRVGAASGEWDGTSLPSLLSNATFASGSNLGIDTTDGNFTLSAIPLANPTLVVSGNNTLTLSGTNSYTGGTVINGGMLQFGGSATVPAGTITVNAGGALAATGPAGYTSAANWLASGKITNASTGVLALNANEGAIDLTANGGFNNLYLGATTANPTYSGTLTPGANGYLLGGGPGTLTVSSSLNSYVPLTVGGSVVLTGSTNNSTGVTINSGGTLQFGSSAAIPAVQIIINGGNTNTGGDITSALGAFGGHRTDRLHHRGAMARQRPDQHRFDRRARVDRGRGGDRHDRLQRFVPRGHHGQSHVHRNNQSGPNRLDAGRDLSTGRRPRYAERGVQPAEYRGGVGKCQRGHRRKRDPFRRQRLSWQHDHSGRRRTRDRRRQRIWHFRNGAYLRHQHQARRHARFEREHVSHVQPRHQLGRFRFSCGCTRPQRRHRLRRLADQQQRYGGHLCGNDQRTAGFQRGRQRR